MRICHDNVGAGNGYDGHCVIQVGDAVYDFTAGQFSRPQFGLVFEEVVVFKASDFKPITKALQAYLLNPCEITYISPVELLGDPEAFIGKQAVEGEKLAVVHQQSRGMNTGSKIVYAIRPDVDDSGYITNVNPDYPERGDFPQRMRGWVDTCWRPVFEAFLNGYDVQVGPTGFNHAPSISINHMVGDE